MPSNYNGRWTTTIPVDKRPEFELYLQSSQKILDRLREICYNMVMESEGLKNNYDNPNWAYKAADSVGYQRALKQIITLLTPVEQKEPMTNG